MKQRTADRRALEPAAFELIEEAVHLLRRTSPGTLAVYYAGTVPFALAGLFFWAHTTWFQPSASVVAWGALGLALLFVAMKAAQAEFCARLLAQRLGAPPPAWSWARFARFARAQVSVQPWVALAYGPALVLTVPLGWLCAYAQSVTVIGEAAHLHDEAVSQAKLWPAQNHVALLILALLAGCAWVNIGMAFYALPWLANRLLGIDNIFGFSGWWILNTTFLASVTALTWLVVDPLVKAFYTLRVFHGRARRTGEDVRLELLAARRRRSWTPAAAAALAVLLLLPAASSRAAESPASPPVVQPAQLDQAIDGVLAGRDFQWRLRPPPVSIEAAADGPIKAFFRTAMEGLRDVGRKVAGWARAIGDWWERHFRPSGRSERNRAGDAGALAALGALRLLLYAFMVVAVVLIAWAVVVMWRRSQRLIAPVLAARAVVAAAPDLHDENLQAAQLPTDGWLALAHEQAARGEWRLALRALYLATLARLAAEGLLSLAKFKTNLDYERELRRRALSRAEIVARFAARRREFENAWYGRAQPGEADVRAWLAELERPIAP